MNFILNIFLLIKYFPVNQNLMDILRSLIKNNLISYMNNIINILKNRQNQLFTADYDNSSMIQHFDKFEKQIQFSKTYDLGLIKLKAEIKNNKLKLTSNKNLILEANGMCRDILLREKNIILNKFYHYSNNLNLVKHGIIYCDIIQEQIVGEEYRQVLQIITLESNENSQILSNNLDLQYDFINNINISIRSSTGNLVKFEDFIYTIVKLHFRKDL